MHDSGDNCPIIAPPFPSVAPPLLFPPLPSALLRDLLSRTLVWTRAVCGCQASTSQDKQPSCVSEAKKSSDESDDGGARLGGCIIGDATICTRAPRAPRAHRYCCSGRRRDPSHSWEYCLPFRRRRLRPGKEIRFLLGQPQQKPRKDWLITFILAIAGCPTSSPCQAPVHCQSHCACADDWLITLTLPYNDTTSFMTPVIPTTKLPNTALSPPDGLNHPPPHNQYTVRYI